MTLTPNLALDRQLCFSLYRTSRLITRAYQDLLAELKLTYPQYLVMLVLWEHQQISMKELAICLDLDSGTLTPLTKKLIGLGLISKERDRQDERRAVLTLTEAGKELKKKAKTIPDQLSTLCSAQGLDLALLKDELDQLAAHLNQESK